MRYTIGMGSWFRHVPPPESRAALISIVTGVVLLGVKFGAYFLTASTAIFADAMEGIVNVTAAVFAFYALGLAHQPADRDHPYGHGKIEFFSAGLEGGMILIASMVAVGKAVDTLLSQQSISTGKLGTGLSLMGIALVLNGCVGFFLIAVGKQRSSITLEADGWHLISDAVTSLAAVAALLLVRWSGWQKADPLMAIAVSFYIAYTGIRLVRRSAAGLMDEQDDKDTAMLCDILNSHVGADGKDPRICSFHKLRHRHSGRYHWIDFHMVVPGHWNIEKGHQAASAIEYEIELAMGGNATAHVEPCQENQCPRCALDDALPRPGPANSGGAVVSQSPQTAP